jgi:hypothetical protein
MDHLAGRAYQVTEGWTTREAHAENFASAQAQALVAKLAPLVEDDARYHGVVPLGGTLRG